MPIPNFISGHGPMPAIGMIVGEAPGYEEDKQGRPFVGASGRLLSHALEDAGATSDEYYITNVYKRRPPQNRTPTPMEIEDHSVFFRTEFGDVQPLFVLALGNVSFRATTGMEAITSHHGVWVPCIPDLSPDAQVMPCFHPAYVLRRTRYREAFFTDVAEFVSKTRIAQ